MDLMVLETQKWLNETYNGVNGFIPFAEEELDGVTGFKTFQKLIQALQIELNTQYNAGLTVDGDFGNGTLNAMPATITKNDSANNITIIIQGSLWCKGYSAGLLDGVFGDTVENAVKSFQNHAGITEDGIIRPYILQGIMNTDGYNYRGSEESDEYYKHLVQLGMNANYGEQIGLTAPNGLWERKSHKNFIKCCQIEWGCTTIDGIWGNNTMNKAPTLSKNTSGYTASKRLLQWGLTINGFYPGSMSGTFDTSTYNAVYDFQDFLCLGADGVVGKNTWASLLSSKGNTSRTATAFDTATKLTETTALALKTAGYTEVGRYLTNTPGGTLDKKLTIEEIEIIGQAGIKIFPIFQTSGREASYFGLYQGRQDGYKAKEAARNFGFPVQTVIYFAVDYDVLTAEITENIIPYFTGISEVMEGVYKIGVYGPRAVCSALIERGLTERSFVADMSSGFTGNIGQKMPSDWSYDQFYETTSNGVGIDKCIASPRATAVSVDDFVQHTSKIMNNVDYISALYNFATKYIKQKKGITPSVGDVNEFMLQYLRTSQYGGTGILGVAWSHLAGERDTDFETQVTYENLDISGDTTQVDVLIPISAFYIFDQSTGLYIPIEHLAATYNAYIHNAALLPSESVLDAYTGWAGDLHQLAANIWSEVENNDEITDEMADEIFSKSNLKERIGEKESAYGFSFEDLCQDVDAFNMYKLYNLESWKLNEVVEDYYFVSKYCLRRFSIFKEKLLTEFDASDINEAVLQFTNKSHIMYATAFEFVFDYYPEKYAQSLAEAFEARIEELIEEEG